jgi:hypothetical protein
MVQTQLPFDVTGRDAVFSPCGRFRYRLDRIVRARGPTTVFVLHNPSTADQNAEDRTSRRGIAFTRDWGSGRLVFVNVWAGIATKPRDLWGMPDPVGPDNDAHLSRAVQEAVGSGGSVVFAWGSINPPANIRTTAFARLRSVQALVREVGASPMALGENQDGSPKHPLYVHGSTVLQLWPNGRAVAESNR